MVAEPVLNPHEAGVILAFAGEQEEVALTDIAKRAGITLAQARSAVERLKMKDALAQTAEYIHKTVFLSEAGQACATDKIPELRLWETLQAQGEMSIQALQTRDDLDRTEAGAAFGVLKQRGLLQLEGGRVRPAAQADISELLAQQKLVEKVAKAGSVPFDELSPQEQTWLGERHLKSLFQVKESKERVYRLTASGWALRGQATASHGEIGQLTQQMLRDGSWQGRRFRRYNIDLPPRLIAGYRNAYRRYLDKTKQTLLSLGFEEMRGSLVENEFWNMDALFMPQFHPARDIHDVYFVQDPVYGREIPEPYLSNVAAAHQGQGPTGTRGWGYVFDKERARRLILRSQGTSLSARQLTKQPNIPGKYFSMARCFRYDSVDATHAPDFIQIEGIVLSEQVTLRHLLGILSLFASEIAQAKEYRAVPDYYPFTEPSVQMHMRHPRLGWIELGGAGIFRPELTQALGIEVPVLAWGLGLDRMAMVALGIDDIRHLFTNNLSNGLGDNRNF